VVTGERGDFIAFLANFANRSELRQIVGLFRSTARFPSVGLILPETFTDVANSDHGSYWRWGFPAVWVTDTGPIRGCPWHSESDDIGALDFPRMTRVVSGLGRVVQELANPK
jgi:hypothetical protein